MKKALSEYSTAEVLLSVFLTWMLGLTIVVFDSLTRIYNRIINYYKH